VICSLFSSTTFFFQAEDGIRDATVTGVQTCALPIYDVCRARGLTGNQGVMFPESNIGELNLREDVADEVEVARFSLYALQTLERSEERRVGKELRYRWSEDHRKQIVHGKHDDR